MPLEPSLLASAFQLPSTLWPVMMRIFSVLLSVSTNALAFAYAPAQMPRSTIPVGQALLLCTGLDGLGHLPLPEASSAELGVSGTVELEAARQMPVNTEATESSWVFMVKANDD